MRTNRLRMNWKVNKTEVADTGEDEADPPSRVIGDEELSAVIRFAGKQFRVRSGSFFEASVSEGKDQWIVEDVLVATNEQDHARHTEDRGCAGGPRTA